MWKCHKIVNLIKLPKNRWTNATCSGLTVYLWIQSINLRITLKWIPTFLWHACMVNPMTKEFTLLFTWTKWRWRRKKIVQHTFTLVLAKLSFSKLLPINNSQSFFLWFSNYSSATTTKGPCNRIRNFASTLWKVTNPKSWEKKETIFFISPITEHIRTFIKR